MGGQLANLSFVEVADGVDGAGHIAEQGPVADEQFGFVAGADDEGVVTLGQVIEDGHALAGHLVPAAELVCIAEEAEVGVDLGRDVENVEGARGDVGNPAGVLEALWRRGGIGHADGADVLLPEAADREHERGGGVQAPREAHDRAVHAGFGGLLSDESGEDVGDQLGINIEIHFGFSPVRGA